MNKSTARPESQPDVGRRQLTTWLWRLPVLAALAGLGWGTWRAYYVHFNKVRPQAPTFRPLEPQRVVTLGGLQQPWQNAPFSLETPTQTLPAIVLRTPEAVLGGLSYAGAHFIGYSRVCTHLGCPVTLRTDLETLAVAFNYRARTPGLACPCHLSVFDPLEAGRAVSGPAREPLPRVQLELRGDALFAVGLETVSEAL